MAGKGCFRYNQLMAMDNRLEPDPVIEAYKSHIDRTIFRKNLQLTVEERLIQLERLQEFAEELRRAGSAARKQP